MRAAVVIVIPARMGSRRFPGKPLAEVAGVPLLQRVWHIARAVEQADGVLIATDDDALAEQAQAFGAEVVMTSTTCATGSDRVAEVAAAHLDDNALVINLQGDAVLTPPWIISALINAVLCDPSVRMATPMLRLQGEAYDRFVALKAAGSNSGTTVVFDGDDNALYFSSGLLPYARARAERPPIYQHIGLYAYRKQTLLQLNALPSGRFEEIEQLEQLRALENGIPIRMVEVDYQGRTHGSVDHPDDVARVERIIQQEGELVL